MNQYQSGSPTLFERCFAAVFSGIAAGVTYVVVMIFCWGKWGAEREGALKERHMWSVGCQGLDVGQSYAAM